MCFDFETVLGPSRHGAYTCSVQPTASHRLFHTCVHTVTDPQSRPETAHILVVDDSKLNRDLLGEYLHALGYASESCHNGKEAVERLQEEPFDAVLLDIDMPELDGYGVLEFMRGDDMLQIIPVIMISGRDDVPSIARCLELGATDFLSKPFNPKILEARLSGSLEKKRLREAEQDLIRMRDALTHMIVHDLGNPLSVIQMNLQMMRMLGEGDADRLGHLERAASAMGTMIESMLDLSKLESGTMPVHANSIDMGSFLAQIKAEYAPFAKDRDLALEIEMDGGIVVQADELLLGRVLANLLANALKYARPATRILLSARPENGHVQLVVEDDGPGIADDLHERIFDRYYQVESAESDVRAGVGLGLAFCRLAMDAMDGAIRAESVSPHGTRFIITLPGA